MEPWKCPTSLDLPSEAVSPTGKGTPARSLAVLGGAVEKPVEYPFSESKRGELQRDSGGFLSRGGSLGRNSK